MEPQTPSQPTSQANQDPTVVALTKTIGELESGGDYNAGDNTGDGAASSGAYGMTPAFIENWEPKVLGSSYQVGQKLTPQQQDSLASGVVKTLGTTGDPYDPALGKLAPAQILSYWNTGNPDAYKDPDYGKNNTYGSTQNYVNKGASIYQNLLSGSGSSNQTASNPIIPSAEASNGPSDTSSNSSGSSTPWWESALGIGAGALGLVRGALSKYGPEISSAIGDEVAGPAGGAAGVGLWNSIFGGGNNQNSDSSQSTSSDNSQGSGQVNVAQELQELNGPISQNSEQLSNVINEAMQQRTGDRVIANSADGQETIGNLGVYGYAPEQGENGGMDFNAAISKSFSNEGKAAQIEQMAAGESQIPVAEVINEATQDLENNHQMTPGARKQAQQDAGTYAREYGNANSYIEGGNAIEARHQQYKAVKENWSKLSSSQIEARKALGRAFRKVSLKYSKNPDLQEAAIKEQQKHINARKVMKRLNGKKAPKQKTSSLGNAILRATARYAEIYIGDKIGGPLGAVLGYLVGDHFDKIMQRRISKTKFDTPQMKAALRALHDTKPNVYDRIIAKLKASGASVPEDKTKRPNSESGLIKRGQNDESKLKGLVTLSR